MAETQKEPKKPKKQTGWAILSAAREKAGISRSARIKRGEGKRGGKLQKQEASA